MESFDRHVVACIGEGAHFPQQSADSEGIARGDREVGHSSILSGQLRPWRVGEPGPDATKRPPTALHLQVAVTRRLVGTNDGQLRLTDSMKDRDRACREGLADDRILEFANDFGAGSPLWTVEGSVQPEDLCLSPELCQQLHEWSDLFEQYHSVETFEWDPGFNWQEYELQGDRLAGRVAEEIGCRYGVRRSVGRIDPIVIRSRDEATSAAAAASLGRWLDERAKFQLKLEKLRKRGGHTRYTFE